eukprot:1157305-Pelagomonas_calceolata.AAC.13
MAIDTKAPPKGGSARRRSNVRLHFQVHRARSAGLVNTRVLLKKGGSRAARLGPNKGRNSAQVQMEQNDPSNRRHFLCSDKRSSWGPSAVWKQQKQLCYGGNCVMFAKQDAKEAADAHLPCFLKQWKQLCLEVAMPCGSSCAMFVKQGAKEAAEAHLLCGSSGSSCAIFVKQGAKEAADAHLPCRSSCAVEAAVQWKQLCHVCQTGRKSSS